MVLIVVLPEARCAPYYMVLYIVHIVVTHELHHIAQFGTTPLCLPCIILSFMLRLKGLSIHEFDFAVLRLWEKTAFS
jgi:hypothetical protein